MENPPPETGPKKPAEPLYRAVQALPLVIMSGLVMWLRGTSIFALAIALGIARLLAYLAPKQHRNYITGVIFFIMLLVNLIVGT